MSNTEPEVKPNGRYPIGEAAIALGIDRATLRKYTVNNMIKCGYNRINKRRFYTGQESLKFWRTAV